MIDGRVPFEKDLIHQALRRLGHPITFFGESIFDKRIRLSKLLVEYGRDIEELVDNTPLNVKSQASAQKKLPTFYSEASNELIKARKYILKFSCNAMLKAKSFEQTNCQLEIKERFNAIKNFNLCGTQYNSPLKSLFTCSLSSNNSTLATGGTGESIKVWNTNSFELSSTFDTKEERIFDLSFNHSGSLLAAAGFSGSSYLFKRDGKSPLPTTRIVGHEDRCSQSRWHQSDNFLGTTSYDGTWRLWDVSTSKNILVQDGHNNAVYAMAFHAHGSLCATGDLDGLCCVWDLRSGKLVFERVLCARKLLCIDFANNSYNFVTAGDDNSFSIHDLRKQATLVSIPAHMDLISNAIYDDSSDFIVTSSYDSTIKIWRSDDYSLLNTLYGHLGRVTDISISKDLKNGKIYSTGFDDKTWKVWEPGK